jgi:hypothetical protein
MTPVLVCPQNKKPRRRTYGPCHRSTFCTTRVAAGSGEDGGSLESLRHCRARAGMHLTGHVLRRTSICFASSTSPSNAPVDGLKGIECLFGSCIDVRVTDSQFLGAGLNPLEGTTVSRVHSLGLFKARKRISRQSPQCRLRPNDIRPVYPSRQYLKSKFCNCTFSRLFVFAAYLYRSQPRTVTFRSADCSHG